MSSDLRTINLMKTLSKSGDTVEQFEKIIEECQNKKIKYTDPNFYPQKEIIDDDKKLLGEHKWRRIEDQYHNLFDNISPNGVQQGKLGDCYFISSLIYISHHIPLVKSLFHPKSSLECGCVLVYFTFMGEKIPVIIDTQVASSTTETINTLFSRPKTNDDSCWFVLVEKAFAKACGGYCYIESGQSSFAMRVLLDQFPVNLQKIYEIIPETTKAKSSKYDPKIETFIEIQKLKKKNAMIGSGIKLTDFVDVNEEEFERISGLITGHAYQLLDVREAEQKRFVKMKNPWGSFEWKGDYSKSSDKWTESLKKELGYTNEDDGSFWMILDDFIKFFCRLDYSLPVEKGWKRQNVFGKIDGYLDGRSPCTNSKTIGCIPQWSIKFTKKTVVRLSYDVSGPISYHGIYICKNGGMKVNVLNIQTEAMMNTVNSFTSGIEYEVKDPSEPFTFFFVRTEEVKEPCYFRILVESPDTKYVIKKFEDNFVKEKWNSVSWHGIYSSPQDNWSPTGSRSLQSCKQWILRFPEMKENEEPELRIQLFKNVTEGPLSIFIAKSDEKVSFAYSSLKFTNLQSDGVSDYEEFCVILDNKPKEGVSNYGSFNQWTLCVYRGEEKDITQFKIVVFCKLKMELIAHPEPDLLKNCGYSISGKLLPGKKDGLSPYKTGVKDLKQWCLTFKKSPTVIYVYYSHKSAKTDHCVYFESKDTKGEKIDIFYKGTTHFDFDVPESNESDGVMWKIEDISKFYALCVSRDKAETTSEYCINIFGDNSFDMHEIIENNKIGKSAPKYKVKNEGKKQVKEINFQEIKFIEQPINFTPKKTAKQKPVQKQTEKQSKEQKPSGKIQKSCENDKMTSKSEDHKTGKADQKPANEADNKNEQKPSNEDRNNSKSDQKQSNENGNNNRSDQKQSNEKNIIKSDQKQPDEDGKNSESGKKQETDVIVRIKDDRKISSEDKKIKNGQIPANEKNRRESERQSKCCLLI